MSSHRLAVLGAAFLFSTGGAAIKACSLTGPQVAGLRSLVAALVLAALVPAARRGWSWRTGAVGLAYAATLVLFVLGNKLTTAANTIFLQSAAPLYILLLAPWLLGERVARRDLVLMGCIAAGLTLFFLDVEPAMPTAPAPLLGNVLGAAAGLTWALTLVGLRWLQKAPGAGEGQEGMRAVVAGNLLAFALCAPMFVPLAGSSRDWLIIAFLGAIQIGIAYLLLTYGFRRVDAFEASLLILIEPALSPLWTWLLHAERPGALALVGGMVILLASTAKSWFDRRRMPAPAESPHA